MLNTSARRINSLIHLILPTALGMTIYTAPLLAATTLSSVQPVVLTPVAFIQTGRWEHAISSYSPPKCPRGFQHFEYVNPDAHRVLVMKDGDVIEQGEVQALFDAARQPYTQALLAAAHLA